MEVAVPSHLQWNIISCQNRIQKRNAEEKQHFVLINVRFFLKFKNVRLILGGGGVEGFLIWDEDEVEETHRMFSQ